MSDKLELKVVFAAVDNFLRPVKAITEGARAASKELHATKEALKGLNAQQKLIDSYRSTNKGIGINAQDLEKSRALVKKLAEEMAATPAPTVAMQRAFAKATEDARNLAAAETRLLEKKQRLRQELAAAGIDTKQLASQQRDLKGRIEAATAAVTKQGEALEAANKKMQRLHAARAQMEKTKEFAGKTSGFGTKAMTAGAAVNAAVAIPVLAYAKAEDSATQLKVALMEKSGNVADSFKEINELAGKLGNKLPGATSDYQDMMTMLIRQGMPAKALLGGLGEATAYLAVQLKMAPTAAAEFASKLQDATRTTDKDMMGLMDTIQKTYYLGVDQNNMLQGFAKISPALSILRQEGLGAANALAPLLVMTDQAGMAGEAAGNAFRKIFQMSLDKKKLAKGNAELSGTGIKLDFSNGKGEFGGLEQMYAQLAKLKGVNTQQRLAALKKIFGDDAETLQALTIMIEKGLDGYREVQGKMSAQADIQQRVNMQLDTLKNLWDAASGTFTNALVEFGESISPELHATAKWLGGLAESVQKFAKENPGFAHAAMTTAKWIGLITIGVGVAAVAIAAVAAPFAMLKFGITNIGTAGRFAIKAFSLIKSALFGAGKVLLWLGRLALGNPILLLIAAIAVAAYLIYENWEPIKKFFSDLFESVGETIDLAWKEIKAWAAGLPEYFTTIGNAIADGLWGGIKRGFEWVKEKLGVKSGELTQPVTDALDIHSPSRVFERLGAFTMQGFEQGLLGGEGGPLKAVGDMAKKLAGIGAGVAIGGAAMAGDIPLDARPPLGGFGMSGGGPMVVTIQIYGAPGQGTDDIQRQVERALANIESRRAAQHRSRLRDSE